MFARNMCFCFIKSVVQDYFKTYFDTCTSIDSKKNLNCCFHRLKYNKVARFYKFMRLNRKVCINVTDCAARSSNCSLSSSQCGRSDNPEGWLTQCRIIEVLLYNKKILLFSLIFLHIFLFLISLPKGA